MAIMRAYFILHFKVNPLVMETLKASMASPTANNNIEIKSMLKTL
jgi:hypothetical protein